MGINQYIQIGSKIKEARLAKGIKQNKMANLLGISVSTYSNYENNYREPKLDLIHQICEILGLEIDELLGLSQFEPEIVDKIANELLKDDIVQVNSRLSNTFHKILANEELSKEDKDLFQEFTKSPAFQAILPSSIITIDTSNPFYVLQEKVKSGMNLTSEERAQYDAYMTEAFHSLSGSLKRWGQTLEEQYQLLNEAGKKKADEQIDHAVEQVKMLTKIPEYQIEQTMGRIANSFKDGHIRFVKKEDSNTQNE